MALFFPHGADTEDLVEANAHLHWLQAVLPIITHLAAIPALCYAWRIGAYRPIGVITLSIIHSASYHLCLSWATMCMGIPMHVFRIGDYIWSPYVMAVGMEFVLRLYVYPWISLVSLAYLAVIIFSTLVNPFSIQTQLLIIVMSTLLLFVKAAYLDIDDALVITGANANRDLRMDRAQRFHIPALLLAGLLMTISMVGFFAETAGMYWLMHSVLWHVPIYLAVYFAMLGTTRDLAGWYNVFTITCGSDYYAMDSYNIPRTDADALLRDDPVVFYSTPVFRQRSITNAGQQDYY
jgi:hypothetical protein